MKLGYKVINEEEKNHVSNHGDTNILTRER